MGVSPSRPSDVLKARFDKHVLVRVIRSHPHWSLLELVEVIEAGGPAADGLAAMTISDLRTDPGRIRLLIDSGPPIDLDRLERGERSSGEEFDALVLEVLTEASGAVATGYLRARVGGPRWKVQASLQRLEEAGQITRTGNTSSTRWSAPGESTPPS